MSNNSHWMTVLERQENGELQPILINLQDVDFIETENRTIVYYIE